MTFIDVLNTLESYGVFDVVLPFLLVFSIVFATLNQIKLLGGKAKIDSIVALAVALLAVRNVFFVEFLKRLLPNTAIIILLLLVLLLFMGLLTEDTKMQGGLKIVAFFIALFSVIVAAFSDYFRGSGIFDFLYYMDQSTKEMLIFFGAIALVIIFFNWSKGSDRSENLVDTIQNWFGKRGS